MNKNLQLLLAIAVSSMVTFVTTSHFVRKQTSDAFITTVNEMEAFNSVGRAEAWDRVEQYLVVGCNSEALELVRQRQSLELVSLKYHLRSDAELIKKVGTRNESITKRALGMVSKGVYSIPTCMPSARPIAQP